VGKLKAFKGARTAQENESNAFRSGQFVRAALFNDDRANRWCRENGIDVRAMGVSVNTAGGFTVPEEMATAIIDLREELANAKEHDTDIALTIGEIKLLEKVLQDAMKPPCSHPYRIDCETSLDDLQSLSKVYPKV